MRQRAAPLLGVCSALLLTGCALFTEPNDEPPLLLTTDRAAYTAEMIGDDGAVRVFGFSPVVEFVNGSRDTVYLSRCRPDSPTPIFGLQMPDGRESAFNPAWGCPASLPLAVAPGQRRIDTLQFFAVAGGDEIPQQPRGALAGRAQLAYEWQRCPEIDACEPSRPVYSPPFLVDTAP